MGKGPKNKSQTGVCEESIQPYIIVRHDLYSVIGKKASRWPLINIITGTKKEIAIWSGFYRKEGTIREG